MSFASDPGQYAADEAKRLVAGHHVSIVDHGERSDHGVDGRVGEHIIEHLTARICLGTHQ